MSHTPHLHIPAPWDGDALSLSDEARHHLERVLRLSVGTQVTYTDGAGTRGNGVLTGEAVKRGAETTEQRRGALLTVAVAPPKARERQRFLVEKLAELGVFRLRWLATLRSEGRAPRPDKARAWARAALEQSRRSYAMTIDGPFTPRDAVEDAVCWVADGAGLPVPSPHGIERLTLLVGPEGGFADEELAQDWPSVALSDGILRVETAAIAGAAIIRGDLATGD